MERNKELVVILYNEANCEVCREYTDDYLLQQTILKRILPYIQVGDKIEIQEVLD